MNSQIYVIYGFNYLLLNMDYEKYRNRFEKLYPQLSDEKRQEIFKLRYDYWKWIIDNYEWFIKK